MATLSSLAAATDRFADVLGAGRGGGHYAGVEEYPAPPPDDLAAARQLLRNPNRREAQFDLLLVQAQAVGDCDDVNTDLFALTDKFSRDAQRWTARLLPIEQTIYAATTQQMYACLRRHPRTHPAAAVAAAALLQAPFTVVEYKLLELWATGVHATVPTATLHDATMTYLQAVAGRQPEALMVAMTGWDSFDVAAVVRDALADQDTTA